MIVWLAEYLSSYYGAFNVLTNLQQLELKLDNFASTKILKNQTKQNEQTTN